MIIAQPGIHRRGPKDGLSKAKPIVLLRTGLMGFATPLPQFTRSLFLRLHSNGALKMFAYMMGKYASLYAICRNVALRSRLCSEYIC
jgi:hypothetical protein